jgi:hypothetical protein
MTSDKRKPYRTDRSLSAEFVYVLKELPADPVYERVLKRAEDTVAGSSSVSSRALTQTTVEQKSPARAKGAARKK